MMSRLIKWRTWGVYSHAAWMLDDLSVIEAWAPKVRHSPHYASEHTTGTEVDLFEVDLSNGENEALLKFLFEKVGTKYDWNGVFGFMSRRDSAQAQAKWFCSELLAAAFEHIQKPLLCRIEAYKVDPTLLSYSPLLTYKTTLLCGKGQALEKALDETRRVEIVPEDSAWPVSS